MENEFILFKERKLKAKEIFYIKEVSKQVSYEFVRKYHYLGDAKFFCVIAFGLFRKKNNEMVGCATYSLPQGTTSLKGWFGLDNQTKNIFELSRLCLLPELNGTNATSFLLGGSIKELKKLNYKEEQFFKKVGVDFTPDKLICRAVVTLANSERHVGSIYQVCNFKYYGLSDVKTDFFCIDGKINPRGSTRDKMGVWIPRARKHRYAYILDNKLEIKYVEQEKPNSDEIIKYECCNGTKQVFDERFNCWYSCPKCLGKLRRIIGGSIEDEIQHSQFIKSLNKSEENIMTKLF